MPPISEKNETENSDQTEFEGNEFHQNKPGNVNPVEVDSPSDDTGLPEKSPDVIENFNRKQEEKAKADGVHRGKLDKLGVPFNPQVHAVDKDGQPRKTVRGNWAKKRGNKPGNNGMGPGKGGQQPQQPDPAQQLQESKICAAFITQGVVSTCTMAISDDWKVESQAEFDSMADPLAIYLNSLGVTQLPPWAVVIGSFGVYAAKRIHKPATKSKLQKGKDWLAKKWIDYRKPKVKLSPAQKAQAIKWAENEAKKQAEKEAEKSAQAN